MADTVHLHIGAPKTGTSFIQRMLWSNRRVLADRGIHLPLGKRWAHYDAAADLLGGRWSAEPLRTNWHALVEDIHATPGTAVVSEELLCRATPDTVARVVADLAPATVHVVHTVRDLGRQVPAGWQQLIRGRRTVGYREWLGRLEDPDGEFWEQQDPTRVFRRWEGVLPAGQFHVVTVPPKGAPPDELWKRFCSVVGIDPAATQPLEQAENTSLGVVEIELLRRFNAQLGDRFPLRRPYLRMVRRHLVLPALATAPEETPIGVPAEFHDWIRERADRMVADLEGIADRVQVVGSATDLRASIVPMRTDPDDVADADLLAAALAAWTRQLAHLETELDAHRADKRRLRQRLHESATPGPRPRPLRKAVGRVLRRR